MRSLRLLFLGAATALPHTFSTRQVAPVSPECPESWLFNIASFSGPGCPDSAPGFNATLGHTDQGWGSHFVPGCHTPWAWFTLPYLEAKVGGGVSESETYCEMRLQWREMEGDNYPIDVPLDRAKWKLKMHRNGTTIEAGYAIEKGVYAKWKFTYWMNEDDQQSQLVDEVVVEGPLQNGKLPAKQLDWSQGKDKTLEWTAPRCGIASIKLRVDLVLKTNASSSSGTVFPTRIGNGLDHDYGWQGPLVGVSHDFEPFCTEYHDLEQNFWISESLYFLPIGNNNQLVLAQTSIGIMLDFVTLALPITQIMGLQISTKKIGVMLMFGVGAFDTVVSILRLRAVRHFAKAQNPTSDNTEASLWSVIEVQVAIVCACMPTIFLGLRAS